MHPIRVELSPDSEVKRRPVWGARQDQNEYLQSASRDEYYCCRDIHYSEKEPSSSFEINATPAAVMLELELDGILRGEKSLRGRGVHRDPQKTVTEAYTPLQRPPPLATVVPSPAPQKTGEKEMGLNTEISVVPDMCDNDHSRDLSSLRVVNNRSTCHSAMRHSIDRFFSASEERGESGAAIVPTDVDEGSASPLDRCSNKSTSSGFSPPPRAPPKDDENTRVAASRTNTDSLSRALSNKNNNYTAETVSRAHEPMTKSLQLTKSADAVGECRTYRRRELHSLPINANTAIPLSSSATERAATMAVPKNTMLVASSQTCKERSSCCVDTDDKFLCPSHQTQHLLDGAEVVMTCESCQMSLTLFVFLPAGSTPIVAFCPLCGNNVASVKI